MKDIVAIIKDLFAAAKDAALLGCVAAVLIFPEPTKAFLRKVGVTSVPTPFGTLSVAESQIRDNTAALTALDGARREVQAGSDAARAVDAAVRAVQAATVRAQEAVAELQPTALVSGGWMYLGTLDPQRTAWKPGVPSRTIPTVSVPFASLHPDVVVQVRTDVNLREARPSPTGDLPRVVRVVRGGQQVRILEIDASRPVETNDPDAPGYRVWARVDILQSGVAAR